MSNKFASGKHAIAQCDRCDRRVKLKELREQVVKQKRTNLLVCSSCLDEDHPQLMLGTLPVYDPQSLRNPRPDKSAASGERNTQWGWAPVGGGRGPIADLGPNSLVSVAKMGIVSVITA